MAGPFAVGPEPAVDRPPRRCDGCRTGTGAGRVVQDRGERTGTRVQIVGLIRFSFAATGDFYPGFASADEMEAFLFERTRLARRFAWFQHLCLPSLARQTDGDWTVILLVGAGMPARWKDRLRRMVAPLPQIAIAERPPGPHYRTIREAFDQVPQSEAAHRVTFRLDDDDAVAATYIATLRQMALHALATPGLKGPVAVAFNRGFYLERGPDCTTEIYGNVERTPLSVGTALAAPAGHNGNIYQHNHRHIAQHVTTLSDSERPMYIRTVHRDNKSNPHRTGDKVEMTGAARDAQLRAAFGVTAADLAALPIP